MNTVILLIALVTLAAAALIWLLSPRLGVRGPWAAASAAVVGLACALAVAAQSGNTVTAAALPDPSETVSAFFGAIAAGDYDTAYTYLDNYSDLGLQNTPESEDAAALLQALRESYSFSFGTAEISGLTARQEVNLTCLSIAALTADLEETVNDLLPAAAEAAGEDSVYDEQENYRSEFVEQVYADALDTLLAQRQTYLRTASLSVSLSYDGTAWFITADSALLSALSGGTV